MNRPLRAILLAITFSVLITAVILGVANRNVVAVAEAEGMVKGLGFNYPSNWQKFSEDDKVATLSLPSKAQIAIQLFDTRLVNDFRLAEHHTNAFLDELDRSGIKISNLELEKISIRDIPATKIRFNVADTYYEQIDIAIVNRLYRVTLKNTGELLQQDRDLLQTLTSSFEFYI